MSRSGRMLVVSILVVFALAFLTRLLPLVWSPYPYNVDGLGEAMFADAIYGSGMLVAPADAGYSDSYVADMPLLNLLVAMCSHIFCTPPLFSAQLIIAALGAFSCIAAMLVVRMITSSIRAGLLSGLFLALLGTYVFCTASVWKECLGMTMMVIIAGLFLERRDARFRAIMTIALFMMTFIHHHSAVITYLIFTFAVAGDAYICRRNNRWSWQNTLDIATALSLWVLAESYYYGIDLPYYGFLSPDQDLYLLAAVASVMLLLMFALLGAGRTRSKHPYLKLAIPAFAAGLLLINYFQPIFSGIAGTSSGLLPFTLLYLVLFVPILAGSDSMIRTGAKWSPILIALVLAPLTMIAFAFLRALDPTSHMIIYRTFDFLDLGMAALFGVGALILARRIIRSERLVVVGLLLLLLMTTPIAFQTETLFGVQNQTYEYEFEAFEFLESMSTGENALDSDQRLSTIARLLFNLSGSSDLAFNIETGRSVAQYQWLVVKSSWTTVGAQEFPLGMRVLDDAVMTDFLGAENVLVLAGPTEEQIIAAVPA